MTALLEQTGIDHRVQMLRGFASRWDSIIFDFDRRHPTDCPLEATFGRDHCVNLIVDALTREASAWADPGLPYREIRASMEELRDALHALSRFESGEGWDGDEDDEKRLYTDETVLTILNADIDWAVWPLLSGMASSNVCFRCTRTGAPVTAWAARLAGATCCGVHS